MRHRGYKAANFAPNTGFKSWPFSSVAAAAAAAEATNAAAAAAAAAAATLYGRSARSYFPSSAAPPVYSPSSMMGR